MNSIEYIDLKESPKKFYSLTKTQEKNEKLVVY